MFRGGHSNDKQQAGGGEAWERLNTEFSIRPLDKDELVTCEGMLERERSGRVLVTPTHHVDEFGDMTGFRYECSMHANAGCLPISRKSFFGHTAVETGLQGRDILRLMSDPDANRSRMREFLEETRRSCVPGSLDCIPDNDDLAGGGGNHYHTLHASMDMRTVDSKSWTPEVPELIGIYHAYLRGYSRDVRTHKLFIVCSGGMDHASNSFSNLMIDVGCKWTCKEVADSEEVWWLRKASLRSRCRLIYSLAKKFDIPVPNMKDIQAYDQGVHMATHCTDTVEFDVTCDPHSGTVSVFSECCDTTRPFNGILTRMHPAEGMWLFRGAQRGNTFGSLFGSSKVCGVFPTSQPRIPQRLVGDAACTTVSPMMGHSCVVRLDEECKAKTGQQDHYLCFDEAYFKNLERMQWNRDYGYMELMPVVVGLG